MPVLSKTQAELYLFDTDTDIFVIQEKEVEVDIALNGEFECRSEFGEGRSSQAGSSFANS